MKINPEGTYYHAFYDVSPFTGRQLLDNREEVNDSTIGWWWDDARETEIEALKLLVKSIRKEIKRLEALDENS